MKKALTPTQEDAIKLAANLTHIATIIIKFLQTIMPDTLARRIVSMVLIAVGIKDDRVSEITGISERSVWTLRKSMVGGDIDSLLTIGRSSGRPLKAKNLESAIVEELEKNNYHTRQQIADMILEKFNVTMSVSTVGRLLKKTASGD